jgi:hypothetical protein
MKKIYEITFNDDQNGYIKAEKDWFSIKLLDNMHLSNTSNWSIQKEDIKNIGLSHLKLNSNSINLQDKTIYRYPKLNLPRQKVDLLKDKFNIKITRNSDIADIHVISYQFIESLLTFEWARNITFKEWYTICLDLKEQNLLSDEALNQLRIVLSSMDKNSIIQLPNFYSLNNGGFSNNVSAMVKAYKENKKHSRHIVLKPDQFKNFNDIINSKAIVAFDTNISEIIYSDLALISNEEYDRIETMATSSDIDNRTLVLEMLANCNIEKSFDVVSGIYWWHYDWLKNTNNWNTVNVKAMRMLLKKYEGGHNISNLYSFNAYIKNLYEDRKLTKFAIDNTRKKLLNTLLDVSIGPNSEVFKVSLENLVLTDKYNNITNE